MSSLAVGSPFNAQELRDAEEGSLADFEAHIYYGSILAVSATVGDARGVLLPRPPDITERGFRHKATSQTQGTRGMTMQKKEQQTTLIRRSFAANISGSTWAETHVHCINQPWLACFTVFDLPLNDGFYLSI